MTFYLQAHPPASPQFRATRREPISGNVFVHTTESALDIIGLDEGAESVAGFISRRPDPGSYHVLVDSDSTVPMIPDGAEAFGCTTGDNRHGWHIAAAARTTDWEPGTARTTAILTNMATEIRAFWQRNGFDPQRAAFGGEPGIKGPFLFCHGDIQGDRTDAWSRRPDRSDLEAELLDLIKGSDPQPLPEDDMPALAMAINGEDRIERFSIDPDGRIVTSWQAVADVLGYSPWAPLGSNGPTGFVDVAAAVKRDGGIVVNGLTAFGTTYQIRQTPESGYQWGAWTEVPT